MEAPSTTSTGPAPADTNRDQDPTPAWVALLGVGLASLAILIVMNPPLLVAANTPSGGDMGAHVLAPAFLRDELLPRGLLQGWSNAWFAGFPIFYFYFPLPSLIIVLLDLVLPYGVAFKLVTVAGLVAMPPAGYVLARSLRLSRAVSVVAAAAAGAFVFIESYTIYGGNVPSTLAGEFSFSWSFALSLVYLGLLIRTVRDDVRWLPWAALALALTALSHVLTTIVVVLASLPILLWRKGAVRTVSVWALGFALSAFWSLPLLARIGLTADMAWSPLRRWSDVLPMEIWVMLLPALAAAIWLLRRTVRAIPVITMTLIPVIYFWLPTTLPDLLPGIVPEPPWKLWNGRLLPYWFFGIFFLTGIAVGQAAVIIGRRLPERASAWWPRVAVAVGAGLAFVRLTGSDAPDWTGWLALGVGVGLLAVSALLPTVVSMRVVVPLTATVLMIGIGLFRIDFIDGWARWNYSGYENKEGWSEYQALMQEIDTLPPGRIQWEANSDLNRYGTPMALMLFPYWSEDHPSMEGLFFESSITTPFHFLNAGEMSHKPSNPIPGLDYHTFDFDRGIAHLEVYDVRYYVSFTEEATEEARANDALTEIGRVDPFTIFELPPSSLVEPADYVPSVWEEGGTAVLGSDGILAAETPTSWEDMALEWYGDISRLDRLVVEDGPEDWPRIASLEELPAISIDTDGRVDQIEISEDRISFRTTAVGVPHLVKVSYFPNWRVEGADGPYRSTPSLMVVVPTEEQVVLRFEPTWAETAGRLLAVLGVITFVVMLVRGRRAEAGEASPGQSP